MTNVPAYLQDASVLLKQDGFVTGNIWYHGTSSALLDSIQTHGLIRSGDKALRQAIKKTMATIGDNSYAETTEPVFLTPSKELAYYWAAQTAHNRSVRFEGKEEPVVIAMTLPDDLLAKVQPDVGAAALLMVQGNDYLEFLAEVYTANGLTLEEPDPLRANRDDFLRLLGMAYLDQDVDARYLQVVKSE
ncbi:MAG: hypothetical protein H7A00_04385 [Hahellaceae bacterium]|nr:hypothetical protein [Hahellaceae bacterium]